MKRNVKLVLGLVASLLVLAVAGVCWVFWSFGEPMYRPGDLAQAVVAGRINPDPAGSLAYDGPETGGTRRFTLEAEPGITLRGFARGQGLPVLVVHGGPGYPDSCSWAGLEPFTGTRRFYYWDQRGCGLSTRPFDRFTTGNFPQNAATLESKLGLAAQVADIERLRRALGTEKLDLVGQSFGGLLACLYAVEFPGRVGKLLLVAPAPVVKMSGNPGGMYDQVDQALAPGSREGYRAWRKAFFDFGVLFSRDETSQAALNAGFIPYYLEAARIPATGGGPDLSSVGGWVTPALFFSLGSRHDWSGALSRISAPVTLVYGGQDLSPPGDFDQYRAIPGLRVSVLAQGNHFVGGDPDLFPADQAIRDFFR